MCEHPRHTQMNLTTVGDFFRVVSLIPSREAIKREDEVVASIESIC